MKAEAVCPPSLLPRAPLAVGSRAPQVSKEEGTLQVLGIRGAQVLLPLQVFNFGLQLLVLILQKSQGLVHLCISAVCSL